VSLFSSLALILTVFFFVILFHFAVWELHRHLDKIHRAIKELTRLQEEQGATIDRIEQRQPKIKPSIDDDDDEWPAGGPLPDAADTPKSGPWIIQTKDGGTVCMGRPGGWVLDGHGGWELDPSPSAPDSESSERAVVNSEPIAGKA
jgi:hypothetical protein